MNQVQEHIEKVREALKDASLPWHQVYDSNDGEDHYPVNLVGSRNWEDDIETISVSDAILIANSPTWHLTSLDIIEQQQREIDSNNELLERILKIYKNHKEAKYHNPTSIELIGKLVEMHLNPVKEVSTDVQDDK